MNFDQMKHERVGPEAAYRAKLGAGSFEIQHCSDCGRYGFYPRVFCKYCGSAALHWVKPSGRATVYSTTVVRRKTEDGGDYNVAVIELDEGPRMMSRIENLAPAQVRIGQQVRASIIGQAAEAVLVFVAEREGNV